MSQVNMVETETVYDVSFIGVCSYRTGHQNHERNTAA